MFSEMTDAGSAGPTEQIFELVSRDGLSGTHSAATGSILSTWADQELPGALVEPMHLRRGLVLGSRLPTRAGVCGLSVLPDGFRIDAGWVCAMAVVQAACAEAWTLACANSCGDNGIRSVWILAGCDGCGMFAGRAQFNVTGETATFLGWQLDPRRL
jgi:hypothetical protein